MKLLTTTAALVALSTAAFAAPTQLELNIGIDADDYGRYSLAELVVIKSNMESERSE
mgnify:CR=1 FL=1